MSRSLTIECEWIDQPAAVDPVERRTWASLRIQAAGRFVTRFRDRATEDERTLLFVPVFPVARWLVQNWWNLLLEPKPSEELAPYTSMRSPERRMWIERHCLRAAESGLLLPRMFLFGDGAKVCLQWMADGESEYPHMPGFFVGDGLAAVDRSELEVTLHDFISQVLARLNGANDPRIAALRSNWKAISEADAEERAFCLAAGRMGLDPYSADDWAPELTELFESGFGDDVEKPLVTDFLEVAEASQAPATWRWVSEAERSLHMRGASSATSKWQTDAYQVAAEEGYRLARQLREEAGVQSGRVDVGSVAEKLGLGRLALEVRNHVPSGQIKAAVGWRDGREPVVAGPEPASQGGRRFLEARGLFHAMFACARGPRLITGAHTWDQQASRAFAAELLAPRTDLLKQYRTESGSRDFDLMVSEMAAEYGVSAKVIEHQFENAGVCPLAE